MSAWRRPALAGQPGQTSRSGAVGPNARPGVTPVGQARNPTANRREACVERFDGATATRWARLAAERLDEQHAWINSINVFPVADSDTGTNSLLTVSGGLEAVA